MRPSVKCSLAVRVSASGAEMFERKMGSANGDGRARVCDTCSSTRDCTSRATLIMLNSFLQITEVKYRSLNLRRRDITDIDHFESIQ